MRNLSTEPSSGRLYIGTSGYAYSHWGNGIFYTLGLAKTKQLQYYSQRFNSVEINYSFYHLPTIKSLSRWYEAVPNGFVFSIKVYRYITHIKRLHNIKDSWDDFFKRALYLKEKLGPFLFQFPPSFKKDLERLNEFIELTEETDNKHRYVLEFRHPNWFSNDVYSILRKKKNISICLADSPNWTFEPAITGSFVYVRMHGGKILYGSNYSKQEIKKWSGKIRNWLNQELDVYVYFNNDAFGYAPKNAEELSKELVEN